MSLSAKLGRFGRAMTDPLIGFSSGATPAAGLDTPQAFRLIFVFGLLGIGLCGWLVFRTIGTVNIKASPLAAANTNTTAIAQLETLKDKDTDNDTLSDYDEVFSYKTSPYLSDSDSDGVLDAKDKDPNCPVGKSCTGLTIAPTGTATDGQVTPAFLRQALRAAGVAQSVLDQTDDAALMSIYQEVLANQPTTTGDAGTTPTITDLAQLSPAGIRQLLKDNGIDQTVLDKLDDTTLRQIFQQALQTSSSSS